MSYSDRCTAPRRLLGPVLLELSIGVMAQVPPPPVSPAPVVNFEYDAQGNPTKSIQAPGQPGFNFTTDHRHDRLNRRIETFDARGKSTGFGYNGRADLVRVTDPRDLVTQLPRNGLGDPMGLTSPDTGTAEYIFDAAGNPSTRLDSRGVLATYGHDSLNRMTSVNYAQAGQASQVFRWTYDQTGVGFSHGIGRLTGSQFPSGGATYAYDAQGWLIATTQTVFSDNTVTLSTRYGYDGAGHITSITYPSGRVLWISHAGGQPTDIGLAPSTGAPALALISGLQFEPGPGEPGAPRSWNWQLSSGALAHVRVFDNYGRMVRYPLGGALRDLTYDAAGRIVSYTHWNTMSGASVPALDQRFGYDELGRLTGIDTGVGSWGLSYDDNGNRRFVTDLRGARSTSNRNFTTYSTSPNSNRLQSLTNPGRTFDYDAAGNRVADSTGQKSRTVVIDPAGREARLTVSSNAGDTIAEYGYNAFGQRVLKRAMGGPLGETIGTVFMYDQEGQLLGEYRLQDGRVLREYVWLQGMPVAIVDGDPSNPVIYYLETDHVNTPRVALDRAGRQRWSWVAEPFGNSAPVENPIGVGGVNINLRMPGQYYDVESGLTYNWHRSYDAGVGRYTQSDPIGLAGGINTYAYVGGNPISRVDPMGLLDRLAFDGRTLTGYEDFGVEFRVPAVSGPYGLGKLPEGVYMGRNLRQRNEKGNKAMQCEGKGWSLDLDPTFRTTRDLLRIHPDGNVPGTEGCIGPSCGANQQTVHDALRGYFREGWTSIPVIVRYPK